MNQQNELTAEIKQQILAQFGTGPKYPSEIQVEGLDPYNPFHRQQRDNWVYQLEA